MPTDPAERLNDLWCDVPRNVGRCLSVRGVWPELARALDDLADEFQGWGDDRA